MVYIHMERSENTYKKNVSTRESPPVLYNTSIITIISEETWDKSYATSRCVCFI